jgi:tetratricopeptide (TPR) repeat protein
LPPPEIVSEPVPQAPTFPRYRYTKPARGAAGDSAAAQRVFAQGVRAQQSGQMSAAVESYREAARLDPAYFEAFYNLGSALIAGGNVSQALTAYESALAIRPDSLDARFNFAMALRQANYIAEAIRELESVLARYPREARVHVLLGNIYAQTLRQNAKAREHYSKALELDPRHPQAANIRLWLSTH